MSESSDKNTGPSNFKNLFNRRVDQTPIDEANKMAQAFTADLSGRLTDIVNKHDSQFITFTIKPHKVDAGNGAMLLLKIHMKVGSLKNPLGAALQIHNAVFGTENDDEHKPSKINILIDTIEDYYQTDGKHKAVDEHDNLTTQRNYFFKK